MVRPTVSNVVANDQPDGGIAAPLAGKWVLTASRPRRIASPEDRRNAGLHHWIDGTVGFATWRDTRIALAPNGPVSALHRGDHGLLDGVVDPQVVIQGLADDIDHASGGPLWSPPGLDLLVLVYHGERFQHGDAGRFRAFLGMAVSVDGGQSFRDLGPIVTPSPSAESVGRKLLDVGPGGFVVRDGALYLYFFERGARRAHVALGVARCRVEDAVAAVAAGATPRFTKYFDGEFAEPALGGSATSLIDDHVLWFDVAGIGGGEDLVLVNASAGVIEGEPMWWIDVRASSDGVVWSAPVRLAGSETREEQMYVSIDGGGERMIVDRSFDLYRLRASRSDRWADARVELVTVDLHELSTPDALSSSHPAVRSATSVALSASDRRRFLEDGYVHLRSAVSPAVVEALRDACYIDDGRSDLSLGAMRFTENLYRRHGVVREFLASPFVVALVSALLGGGAWLRWDQAVWKHPGGPAFPLHQDNGYTQRRAEHLQVWVALTDMTLQNGGLVVAPGDHRALLPHRWVGGHAVIDSKHDTKAISAAAGDVVVFSSLLPHMTGPNTTNASRLAYIAEFLPLDVDDPHVPQPHFVSFDNAGPVGRFTEVTPGGP